MDHYYVQRDEGSGKLDQKSSGFFTASDPGEAAVIYVQKMFRSLDRPEELVVLVRSYSGRVDTRWHVTVQLVPRATARRVKEDEAAAAWLGSNFVNQWWEAWRANHWLRLNDLMEQAQGKVFDLVHGPNSSIPAPAGPLLDVAGVGVVPAVVGRVEENPLPPIGPTNQRTDRQPDEEA